MNTNKLRRNVFELIKANSSFDVDEIISKLKKMTQYSNMGVQALKPSVSTIVEEIKKELKQQEQILAKEAEESKDKMLGKKRISPDQFLKKDEFEDFLYKPKIKLSDLGGMDNIIGQIRSFTGEIMKLYDVCKKLSVEPTKGILLCGPPGCGKTTLACAIGGEYEIPFYKITAPQLVSSLSGETEQKIRKLFERISESAPAILFIDEIDSILGKRENAGKEMERRIVAQFVSCMDDIAYDTLKGPVFIIGATSKPEYIDSALRRSGRFDREINIGFPNEKSREDMLIAMTKNKKLDEDVSFSEMAKLTPGYLAADLEALIREAGLCGVRRIGKIIVNKTQSEEENTVKNQENEKILSENGETNISIEENFSYTINMSDFIEAVSKIQPTSKREGFTTIPDISWSDIGGLDKLREELNLSIVRAIRFPQIYRQIGIKSAVGVLLYGPPGCGKTLLAKAVANESKSNFISIKGPELLNKYVGESERAVRALFQRARDSAPCIIFFDEIDSLCPKRGNENNQSTERVVNQLLTEMDGVGERKDVYIIAATNRPDIIDPAILRPGRLGKILYVPIPDVNDRVSILKTHCRSVPLCEDVDIAKIATDSRLNGFTGADIANFLREAQMNCIKRLCKEENVNNSLVKVSNDDFDYSFSKVFGSVSKKDQTRYENLQGKLMKNASHLENPEA